MSLVVARVTPLGVRLAGDMRIVYPNAARPPGFLDAALKVVLIRPTLCIAYAGSIGVAVPVIREVAQDGLGVEAASRRLLESHLRSEQRADFIVASLRPSALSVLRHGERQESESGWIGDHAAYSEYQEHYFGEVWLAPKDSYDSAARAEDIEVASRMSYAMEAVVFGAPPTPGGYPPGGSHSNVGEAIVKVVPRVEDNLFKYAEMNRAESSRREEPLPPGLGVVPPDWGSPELGAFSYSMLTPRQPGVGAIGLYFYEGRLGVLYSPLILGKPETYRDTTPEGFIEVVRLRHGIELGGFVAIHQTG